jgi:tRNA threonylcarbamoyladenosine biosynthesis protein TsaE
VVLRTGSAGQTRELGAALAGVLLPGDVVLVAGELGAGKTTLVQGVGSGLGVADAVTSPTFTLVRPYRCDPARRRPVTASLDGASPVRVMLHADLYRLDRLGEVADLALAELVEESAVALVEWGDVAEPLFGRDTLEIRLDMGRTEDQRRVTIMTAGSWEPRRAALVTAVRTWVDEGSEDDR